MALLANGVGLRILVPSLLFPSLLAVYFSTDKFSFTNTDPKPPKPVEFDYYILEIGWAPSICREEVTMRDRPCRTPWPTIFTLHGLWPAKATGKDPEFCPEGEEFDLEKIRRITKDLEKYWPGLRKTVSNDEFWKHEWDKHGRCSNLDQLQYFKLGLQLYGLVDLSKNLNKIDVTPGNSYDPTDVATRYGKKFKQPRIKCGKRTLDPVVELIDKFQFKIKKNGKTIEAMPKPYTTCRTTPVEFPK